MQVHPYLFFDGRCEEAIEFYKKALGAEVRSIMRFKVMPDPDQHGTVTAASGDKILSCARAVSGRIRGSLLANRALERRTLAARVRIGEGRAGRAHPDHAPECGPWGERRTHYALLEGGRPHP